MQVKRQVVGYEAMVRFLSKQFGVKEPIGIDKDQGILTVIGGQGREICLTPLRTSSYMSGMVLPDGQRVEFPLPEAMFILDCDGDGQLVVDALQMDGFVVDGYASPAVVNALGLSKATYFIAA